MIPILTTILLLISFLVQGKNFYVNYNTQIDLPFALAHDFSILSAETAATNLVFLKNQNHTTYGYLSVVEVAPNAGYLPEFRRLGIPVLATNAEWKSMLADVTDPKWQSFVVNQLATQLKDFDGFFLDTVESIETLAQLNPQRADNYRRSMVTLVRQLKSKFPDKKIIANRGFKIWDSLTNELEGVLIESMFHSVHPVTKKSEQVSESDTSWLMGHAKAIQKAGLNVYVLDYVPPGDITLAQRVANKIRSHGFHALVSTPELDGKVLAPVREVSRRILVLFGNEEPDLADYVRWPADTVTSMSMQTALEYLGYELDFIHILNDPMPVDLSRYAAVLTDPYLEFPIGRQKAYADLLVTAKNAGKKVIFTGNIPFSDDGIRKQLFESFNMRGDGELISGISNLTYKALGNTMEFEEKIYLRRDLFYNLQAPVGATNLLSISAQSSEKQTFHPVFVAAWGGVAHKPYLTFRGPDYLDYWIVNPFEFFRLALNTPNWPIPDVTTRDGVRALITHIDGDGLGHKSAAKKGKLSSELVRDEILKKYPFRATVSVIESEIRALIEVQEPSEETNLVAVSKSMFELPNVEAASHTFSHPFYWMADDRTADLYESRNLKLKHGLGDQLNFAREVTGSVDFINKFLLPPGKKVEIFLWSGNCRPPEEAVRLTRELGIENMNGGNTIASDKFPSISAISPRIFSWGSELMVTAPVQNENVYRDPDHSFFQPSESGMFINAIDTFERTESPRRLKPVNIYYHFYSADNAGGFNALKKLYDWAVAHELHSIHASDYARSARDAHSTRLFLDNDQWIVSNQGAVRTLRFEQPVFPDYASSVGITGANGPYIHTAGKGKTIITTARHPAKTLFLVKSTGPIAFDTPLRFSVEDFRPVKVVLGSANSKSYRVSINGSIREIASENNQLTLALPARATVELESTAQ